MLFFVSRSISLTSGSFCFFFKNESDHPSQSCSTVSSLHWMRFLLGSFKRNILLHFVHNDLNKEPIATERRNCKNKKRTHLSLSLFCFVLYPTITIIFSITVMWETTWPNRLCIFLCPMFKENSFILLPPSSSSSSTSLFRLIHHHNYYHCQYYCRYYNNHN